MKHTNLGISVNQFKSIYGELFVKQYGEEVPFIFTSEPKSEEEFKHNYIASKLWRLNHLYQIIDKSGKKILLKLNKAQHMLHAELQGHARQIALKSRQQGISTYSDTTFFDDAITLPNLNVGLTSQGNEESSKLLDRTKLKWDELPEFLKQYLGIKRKKSNKLEFAFNNNSTIFIRQSFASTTLQRLWISEFGKIAESKPQIARELHVGTMQAIAAGHPIIIESTARGANRFKDVWDTASDYAGARAPKDFNPFFLSWVDDGDCSLELEQTISREAELEFYNIEYELSQLKDGYWCSCERSKELPDCRGANCNCFRLKNEQKWWWVQQYRELGEDIFQEYPAFPMQAFLSSQKGTYYMVDFNQKVAKNKRVVRGLYSSKYSVRVIVDLGLNDDMVFLYYQEFSDEQGQYRLNIVHEDVNNELALSHYMENVKRKQHEGWKIERITFPHDASKRDFELNSVIDLARKLNQSLGLFVSIDQLTVDSLLGGIQAVKHALNFISVEDACTNTLLAFRNYKKTYDEGLGVFKDRPVHDKFSHCADAIRYMVARANVPTEIPRAPQLQGPKQFVAFRDFGYNELNDFSNFDSRF